MKQHRIFNEMKKYILGLTGIWLIGLAIALLIRAGFGLDAFNALLGNLAALTGFSFSVLSLSIGALFVLLNTVVSRKRFNVLALGVAYMIGLSIDVMVPLVQHIVIWQHWAIQGALFVSGILLYGFAVALLIRSTILSPLEEYLTAIKTLFKTNIARAKLISDISLVVVALAVALLGSMAAGQVGIGTLIITAAMGKVIDLSLKLLDRLPKSQKQAA